MLPGGQEPGRLAGPGQPLRRHRLRPGLADAVGLSAHRQGVEAAARRCRRGQVFAGQPEDVSVGAFRDQTPGFERDCISRSITFWTPELFLRRDGKLIKIEKPDDATERSPPRPAVHRAAHAVEGRRQDLPAGALLATDFEAFLQGERQFDVLFEPTERKSLAGFTPDPESRDSERAGQRPQPSVRPHAGGRTMAPRRACQACRRSARSSHARRSGRVRRLLHDGHRLSDAVQPVLSARWEPDQPEKLKAGPAFFDATGLAVSQHEAVSKDGTRIPYFQVARNDLARNGKNPTLLYGYGGFEISMTPGLRGGDGQRLAGEGRRVCRRQHPRRRRVRAEVAPGGAKAEPPQGLRGLHRRRRRPDPAQGDVAAHLGMMGGSNGGLLMGNMLTLRPDLFGAIVCQVPLLDMQRYPQAARGRELDGGVRRPRPAEEWEFIRTFSPYHNVKKDVKYPRTLFTTSTRDDRVHPGHARKMVAQMKEHGHDVLYYENIEGGHGGAADNKQAAFMSALAYTFLWKQLK